MSQSSQSSHHKVPDRILGPHALAIQNTRAEALESFGIQPDRTIHLYHQQPIQTSQQWLQTQ